jgi:hypothetical protein
MRIGDKIKMEGEQQRYTVKAFDKRFVILTKPFNPRKTYLYSIIDLERGVRGRDNLIFGFPYPYNTEIGSSEAIRWLNKGEMEVSYRHYKPLEESELKQITK